jgi:hypothetical protein
MTSTLSKQIWSESLQTVTNSVQNVTVFTGHASGGLLAKAMASYFNAIGVAIESPVYDRSVLSLWVEIPRDPYVINFSNVDVANYDPDIESKIFNVFAPSVFFSFPEELSVANIRFRTKPSGMKTPSPYHSFCYIAAGCVSDDQFDHLCSSLIGMEKYNDFFQSWGRVRQ